MFIRRHADRLFAAFCLLGSLLILKAGNYADNNGDNQNPYLTLSGIADFIAEIIFLIGGQPARPIAGPCFLLAAVGLLLSGIGFFGLSNGSMEEAVTGLLMGLASGFIFYGDRLFPDMKISGGFIGGWLFNLSCIPLLAAGIRNENPFEWGSSCAFIAANLIIATKSKTESEGSS